jgi:crotonobetainyl-CoA:carnitine CoA-transferase CaiB-like acyl-CoA transferase
MLEDLKVIDLSTVLAGPSVGTFLAELGAEVTKYEHPDNPDVTRSWLIPGEQGKMSSYFSSINYRKSYSSLNLSHAEQYEMLIKKLESTDVLIMNFKSHDYEKFNLTSTRIKKDFPRLIVATVNGFGDDSDRVAYDLILQAESGFMSINGWQDSPPLKMPVALIDVLAAHHLKEGILLALLQRQKTGLGAWLSVSLYDAAVCSLTNQASAYLMHGIIPKKQGSLHPNIAPYGEVFQTKDNKWVTFAIGSNRQFQGFCAILGCQELGINSRYVDNVDRVANRIELAKEISPFIIHWNAELLREVMTLQHIPMGIIYALNEVFENPHAQELVRTESQGNTETKRLTQVAVKWK